MIPGLEPPKPAARKMTAKELVDALRRHHEPPPSKPTGGYFVSEIQAPGSMRRADALWVPVNTAARGQIHGYETKVTRQDVIIELRDPMKADAWQKYCDYWWLVIPDGSIIDGLDIPDSWGIMMPPSTANRRTMTVIRKAPRLDPVEPRAALGTILAKLVYGGEDMVSRVAAAQRQVEWWQKQAKAYEEEAKALRPLADNASIGSARLKVTDVLTEMDRLGDAAGAWLFQLDATHVASAIVAQHQRDRLHKQAAQDIDNAIRDAERIANGLRKARDELRPGDITDAA